LSLRDLHLKTASFLDVRRYPVITYSSQHIERVGPDRFAIYGLLSLHGWVRPVRLEAVLEPDDGLDGESLRRAHVTGSLFRSAFAIPRSHVLRAIMRSMISDEVAVTADVRGRLVRESGAAAPLSAGRVHD